MQFQAKPPKSFLILQIPDTTPLALWRGVGGEAILLPSGRTGGGPYSLCAIPMKVAVSIVKT